MEKLVEYLYSKFLYRDLLSYAFPGAIVLFSVAYAGDGDTGVVRLLKRLEETKVYLAVFAFAAYLTGLSIQALGTFGYEYNWWPFLRFYPSSALSTRELNFSLQDAEFNAIAVATTGAVGRADRLERFAALKQVYGNAAVAVFILGICVSMHRFRAMQNCYLLTGVVFLTFLGVAFLLWREHRRLVLKEQVWRELVLLESLSGPVFVFFPQEGRFVPVLKQLQKKRRKEAKCLLKFIKALRVAATVDTGATSGKK